MRNRSIRFAILLTLGALIVHESQAKDHQFVFDLINNQSYAYQQKYTKLIDNKWNFYESVGVTYPYFTGLKDTHIERKVNNRIKYLMLEQVRTEEFKVKLFNHLNEVMDTYLELYNKKVDRLGYYRDNQYKFTPDLEDIEYQFVSCFDHVVAMVVQFEYSTSYKNKKVLDNISYYQIFYFDLESGKEFTANQVFLPSERKNIENLVVEESQKNMAYIDRGYIREKVFGESRDYQSSRYDYYGRNRPYETVIEPKFEEGLDTFKTGLIDFNLNENGFTFFKAFSLSYFIPAYQACTKQMFGYSLEVRLTLDQVKPYLNPYGPYGGLVRLKLPDRVSYKNMHNPLSKDPYNGQMVSLGVYDNMPYHIDDTLVTLVRETRPTSRKDKNGEWIDTSEIVRELVYQNGKLSELRTFSNSKVYARLYFTYDSLGNLIKSTKEQRGELQSSTDYFYDSQNNLLKMMVSDYRKPIVKYFYGYFDDFILEERYGTASYREKINYRYTKKYLNEFDMMDSSYYTPVTKHSKFYYSYGDQGQLLYMYRNLKSPEERSNYVYDSLGRLISYEYDKGRYLNYWQYDSTGRIVKHVVMSSFQVQQDHQLIYDEKGHLIRVETLRLHSNNRPYIKMYEYLY